jgi:hypothetical protein
MRSFVRWFLISVLLAACSNSSGGPGTPSAGGFSENGGSGSGGKTGTGGANFGGTTGSGGSPGTGGKASGGSPGTGGDTSSGGTSTGGAVGGAGGSPGSGGSKLSDGSAGSSDAGLVDATSLGGNGSGGKSGSGGEATGGVNGSGGSPTDGGTFDPCPTSGDCKILPLGDSISWGINYGGGYRIKLFTHTTSDQKNVTFVGYDTGNPPDSTALAKLGSSSSKWVGKHEGHSGWTIQQDDDLVTGKSTANNDGVNYTGKKVVADFGPNIVLVHLGTNDLNLGQANGAPDRLGTLIDHIVAAAPNALVVVAKIIPLPGKAAAVTTFNAAIPGVVKQRADAGKHVIVVDQFSALTSSDMDQVHPFESGYEKMAVVWYNAIKPYLH